MAGGQTTENGEQFGEQFSKGHPGQPSEIAPASVQLATAQASYVTGQVYGASGGSSQS